MELKNRQRVEYLALDALTPYERNARTHSDEQIELIAQAIEEFGWTNPILIDENNGIIAGHGRLLAARRLGLSEVPCIRLAHLSEVQRRAYIIADNALAERAGWDEELLALEVDWLAGQDFDLDLTGLDDELLGGLLAPGLDDEAAAAAEEAPEPPENPVAALGDLWILGDHRLICGDSTRADVVERLLDGARPHLMVTDPPYGVEYDADWRNRATRKDGSCIGGRAIGKVLNDNKADWREAWALFPGDVAYVWHAGVYSPVVADSLTACDFEIRSQIIWAKTRFALSRGHYHWQHEPCWYAVKKGANGHWHGDRSQSTLWEIEHTKSETGHSTQKPIEAMRRPILNNSKRGDAVYEPFCGSGTTLIACEMEGRRCYAIELNPAYVDVIIRRWQELTGQQAVLDGDGRSFDEIAAKRLGQAVRLGEGAMAYG